MGPRLRGDDSREFGVNIMSKFLGAAIVSILFLATPPAMADAVADFYKGKQIRVIVRTTPATDYDEYSRLIARFMG
jgi:hypothetical protein